jgi:glycosyltransferase involved in cell wall biosynthesis
MGADLLCIDMHGKIVHADAQHSLDDYDLAVVQTCWYDWQNRIIKRLRMKDIKILINVDDWIQGIGKRAKGSKPGQMWYDFTKKDIQESHLRILRQSDGILASTPILAAKLSELNEVGLAPNGVDLHRYEPWRDPTRDDGVIFGWAGGVGHQDVIREIAEPVSSAIADLNAEGVKAKLCVVGQDERISFGQPDALHLKWADKFIYPQYLSCFDVSLAPSRDDSFYRYKSQLRLYEAAALGTPTLGGSLYASEMDGFGSICLNRDDWYDLCMELGRSEAQRNGIRDFCYNNVERFTIESRIGTWESSIRNLSGFATSVGSQHSSSNTNDTSKTAT